jgi:SAM-dependent methyltransferase
MFFADPAAAFAAMRAALKPGGRVAFVCWRPPSDNPWMMVPMAAGVRALGVASPIPADPFAPGPFAFADDARVRAILAGAGYVDVAVERFDAPMRLGEDPATAALMAIEVGPLAALVREHGGTPPPALLEGVAAALAAHAGPDGVRLAGSTWVVTARTP